MDVAVQTDYDETRSALVLSGDLANIVDAPLVAAFLRSKRAVRVSATEVNIPTAKADIQSTYEGLSRVLGRYGVTISYVAQLSQEMQRIRDEEKLFFQFSTAAAAIWGGQVDPDEFQRFVEVVSEVCPGRTFFRLQLISALHLAFSQHACNFSVPGAGKTSIVYAAFAYLKSLPTNDPKHVDHILVIGPLSSFKAWEDEFREIFSRPARRKRLIGGMGESEREAYLRGISADAFTTELTLTSYQTLASLDSEFSAFLAFRQRRVMVVLDEAHNIKRPDGVWSSAALRLSHLGVSRVVLTGTPAPNGYEDLENLFEFIHPKRRIIGYSGAALKAMSIGRMTTSVDDLKRRITPFYTRIRKRDLNLPSTVDHIVSVPLVGAHAEIYGYVEGLIMPSIRGRRDAFQSRLLRARLMRLRQAATNPALLLAPLVDEEDGDVLDPHGFSISDARIFDAIKSFSPNERFAKIDALKSLVERLFTHHTRILVWSVFIANLLLIVEALRGSAPQIEMISGMTPVEHETDLPEDRDLETREKIIDRFLSSSGRAILIANPQSIGESISLHKGCHAAIYYDRDFNAGKFIQSKDRIHRYGLRPDTLTEYHFLSVENSVEVDIHARLAQKENRLNQLIDQDDIPLFKLVLGDDEEGDDIRQILESYERRKVH